MVDSPWRAAGGRRGRLPSGTGPARPGRPRPPVRVIRFFLAAGRVPEPHDAVLAGAGDRLAVGAEGDRPDLVLVPAEGAAPRPGFHVPDGGRLVGAGRRHPFPIGTERDPADPVGVSLDRL